MSNHGIEQSGPVWALLKKLATKSDLTEVVINGPNDVFVERNGEFIPIDVKITADSINKFVQDVSIYNQRDLDENNPLFNGSLPDGSRVNIAIPPVRMEGPAITIRKFLKTIQSFDSRRGIFGLSPDWVNFFKAAIKARLNIIVSGGTGVGKTTFLNLLLQEVDKTSRKVIIEDVREVNINMPNTIRMESMILNNGRNISTRELVKNSLRMRPDRIIIGEIRGEEIFDLLQAMNTGHEGCFATIHANNPKECLSRLEALYLLSGYDVPFKAIRHQIGRSIDLIVQLKRNRNGTRVVSHVAEITDLSGDQILMQDIGKLDKDMNYIISSGLLPKCINKLEKYGFNKKLFLDDF